MPSGSVGGASKTGTASMRSPSLSRYAANGSSRPGPNSPTDTSPPSAAAADFDGQAREVFARLDRTLGEAGGRLADMVTMTVFITDPRRGDRFTQLRCEIFGDNFPASALITVAGLARPEMLVEVQGIAVLG